MSRLLRPMKPFDRLPPDPGDGNATFTRRSLLLGLFHATAFGALASRLYQIQVLEGASIAALAEDNRMRTLAVAPVRGRIFDAAGRMLAGNAEVFRILYEPPHALSEAQARTTLIRLAELTGLPPGAPDRLYEKLRTTRPPITIAENVPFEQVAALQVQAPGLDGVRAEAVSLRNFAVTGDAEARAMSAVVGYVGALERRALDDAPMLRLNGARIGKAGVEAGMEAELRGVAGQIRFEVDARSRYVRRIGATAPHPGRDVTLTIDTPLQTAVLDRLAATGRPSAAVVLECATGAVRAMASTPAYDVRQVTGAGSKAAWQSLNADPDRPLLNRAVAGLYPPGSTFKMVTAIAALDAGTVAPKEKIECWGDVTYSGHTYRCWNRKGHITSDLHKALRESCDCYFYEAARRTGIEKIAATAHTFGLGQTFDAGIAQQRRGVVPTPAWKRGTGRPGWLIGETIMAGIGQGYVLTTPLQLAVMTARIATGLSVAPTLIAHAPDEPPPAFAQLATPPEVLEAIRKAMVAVVNEPGGTGQEAALDEEGILVAAKTGTSQVSRASALRDPGLVLSIKQRDHALMVAFWPARAPKYAAAVVLENAGGGGAMAGPVMHDLIKLISESAIHRVSSAASAVER